MNVNIVMFDDFETLDAFGPAEVFGRAPEHFHINYLSVNGGIVNSTQGVKVWTEILEPEEIRGVLVIPGGKGAKRLLQLEEEALSIMKKSAELADLCMMVGNGSALLAQTGLLYHRKIVDYAYDENWKRMFTAGVTRISNVRWMSDGKYYSCSSTAASLDMALSVTADLVDVDVAEKIAAAIGYTWDPYSEDGVLM